MSRFVTPRSRVNGPEGNVTVGRGAGQWEGRMASGEITPPASDHRPHSAAECGRAEDARAAAVSPVRARAELRLPSWPPLHAWLRRVLAAL